MKMTIQSFHSIAFVPKQVLLEERGMGGRKIRV